MGSWFKTAKNKTIQKNGLLISILVGSILNLINQGDVILSGSLTEIHCPKIILTYCVPYCVAVFAGTEAARKSQQSQLS